MENENNKEKAWITIDGNLFSATFYCLAIITTIINLHKQSDTWYIIFHFIMLCIFIPKFFIELKYFLKH